MSEFLVNKDNYGFIEGTKKSEYDALQADHEDLKAQVNNMQAAVGSPLIATEAADMTDTTKIYVYVGSESGYTFGNWYYYNGTSWVSGGVYNSVALETDKTLTVEDMAADAQTVGEELTALSAASLLSAGVRANNSDLNDIDTNTVLYLRSDYSYVNAPSVNNLHGILINVVSNQYVVGNMFSARTQIIICEDGRRFSRNKHDDTWSAWIEELDDIKKYNVHDIFKSLLVKKSGTRNGIDYDWQGDTCIVSGIATNYSANVLLYYAFLPDDVKVGETYHVKYSTTHSSVFLRIIFQDGIESGATIIKTEYISANKDITIPEGAVAWTISVYVPNGINLSNPATVSDIRMISALTTKELEKAALVKKGILPSGTDIDSVDESGFYLLNSGYSYSHTPISSGYGGNLFVYHPTPNVFSQYVVSIEQNPKIYGRTSIGGSFRADWALMSGNVYNNTYNSEHYENSYNISCSPTITADTNNYLASTGDNTDRTADIQAMLNSTGICNLGSGRFVVSGITVPAWGCLRGCSNDTVIILNSEVTTGYAVKMSSQSSVENVRIAGTTGTLTLTGTVGTRHGILWEGTKISGQSGGDTVYRGKIQNCSIHGFTGGGITCTGTGVTISTHCLISDCEVWNCEAGIYIPYYSEFHRISNCSFQENYYGCINNGGNNNFSNCDFSSNTVGILIDNSTGQSPNIAHGSYVGCSIKHSGGSENFNTGYALKILGVGFGESFNGCRFAYGEIDVENSSGIQFTGCSFSGNNSTYLGSVEMSFDGAGTTAGLILFNGCIFTEMPIINKTNNPTIVSAACYLRTGAAVNI